jgi:hypothetical protein
MPFRRCCMFMAEVNWMRAGKRVRQIPHAEMHYVYVEQLGTSKMGNDV